MWIKKQRQWKFSYFSNKIGKIPLPWWNNGNCPVIIIYACRHLNQNLTNLTSMMASVCIYHKPWMTTSTLISNTPPPPPPDVPPPLICCVPVVLGVPCVHRKGGRLVKQCRGACNALCSDVQWLGFCDCSEVHDIWIRTKSSRHIFWRSWWVT